MQKHSTTEQELRAFLIRTAEGYLGVKEGSGKHREIVDLYNSHKPLARGYALQYTDAWCAGFVGAMAVLCGLTEIIPMEVSCPKLVELAKEKGIWVEDDGYVPDSGDIILFYWKDDGVGDAAGGANHVGFVASVEDGKIMTVEGNMSDRVGSRSLSVDGRYIRGFICPDYGSVAAVDEGPDFADVPSDAYYGEAVRWAGKNGIVTGVDDTHFQPDSACTRAQAVTMLWRLLDAPDPRGNEGLFWDVDTAAYYARAVWWAAEQGITNGMGDNQFGPEEQCSRAQAVTFLWRWAGRPETGNRECPFVDLVEDAYYQEAVLWAYENSITAGMDAMHFEPDSPCTRAQMVTFLYRFSNL